jgi:hypothetical protein
MSWVSAQSQKLRNEYFGIRAKRSENDNKIPRLNVPKSNFLAKEWPSSIIISPIRTENSVI